MAGALLRGARESLRCLTTWYLSYGLTLVNWLMRLDVPGYNPALPPPDVLIQNKRACIVIIWQDAAAIPLPLRVRRVTKPEGPST